MSELTKSKGGLTPAHMDIDKIKSFVKIASRNCGELQEYKVFDQEKLDLIAEDIQDFNRTSNVFGRSSSQFKLKMMDIYMMCPTGYSRLWQIQAKIEKARDALKHNGFKTQESILDREQLQAEIDEIQNTYASKDAVPSLKKIEIRKKQLKIQQIDLDLADSQHMFEGTIKNIRVLINTAKQVREHEGIPENWDEAHFEAAEEERHFKQAVRQSIRDIEMHGRINPGNHEYIENTGCNPIQIKSEILAYARSVRETMEKTSNRVPIPPQVQFEFEEKLWKKYKNNSLLLYKALGLQRVEEEALFLDTGREGIDEFDDYKKLGAGK